MTDRMLDDQLDREVRDFLAWQAEDITEAPTATEMATRITASLGARNVWLRRQPQLVWVLLAGVLIAALISALLVGAALLRHDPVLSSYEAVFLRLDEMVDGSVEVDAVGVNGEGRERQIARLSSAWVKYGIGNGTLLAPMGAVSSSGLLAIPHGTIGGVEWEIFDLHRPQVQPIVVPGIRQDVEQLQLTPFFRLDMRPSVFWGPEERLAIPWYDRVPPTDPGGSNTNWHLSFVNGRTGASTTVDLSPRGVLLPWWASDGSGVFFGSSDAVIDPPRVLRPDGTFGDGTVADAVRSCRTRNESGAEVSTLAGRVVLRSADYRSEEVLAPGGVGFACFAPDDSAIVLGTEIGSGTTTAAHPIARLIASGSGARYEIEGSFAGWMEVDR
jgi:hypothetical protein